MIEKIFEQCNHHWETIEKIKEYVGSTGNSITGGTAYFNLVYIQQCTKCGKIHKTN